MDMEREIHEIQVEKYGEKVSTSIHAPGHSLRDTGKLIGKTGEHVRQSIMISKTAEKFPALFICIDQLIAGSFGNFFHGPIPISIFKIVIHNKNAVGYGLENIAE